MSDTGRIFTFLFPPSSARREVITQAMGNLLAAYIILLVACAVGVGS